MATYLIRCVEVGREIQSSRGKVRRDLARVIHERFPDASIATAPGRLFVDANSDVADLLAALPGVSSVSPCQRVSTYEQLLAAVLDAATRRRLGPDTSFAIRVRRRDGGQPRGTAITRGERSLDLARQLGDAVAAATGAPIDLARPDVELGIELSGDEAFVFDRVIHGIDRTGPPAARADGEPRFLVDQMLGRLTPRLRLLGYDATTVFDLADSELTRLAAAEGRILLTRDTALARTRAVPVLRVAATSPRAQLAEVLAAFGLEPDPARMFTRCTLCNTLVEAVEEAEMQERIPPGVRGRGLRFSRCPSCAQVYWDGSHVERIFADLGAAGVRVRH